jgi:hypothetical protein
MYQVSHARISSTLIHEHAGFVSTTEGDSHADTFVAGKNCVPLHYTDRSCDVQPYSDDYKPMKNVPIVTAATGYTSATGMNYILVFPEALYIPSLEHSLFNPNQLRHFGSTVQDNPYSDEPMSITNPDGSFTACLQSKGTDIFLTTWAPSSSDLEQYPRIILCSSQPWNPRNIRFPGISVLEQEEIEVRNVQKTKIKMEREHRIAQEHEVLFDLDQIRRRITSSARITTEDLEQRQERRRIQDINLRELPPPVLPGPLEENEILPPHTFLSSERHSKTTPEVLSERWGLSLAQAALTLKATTRKLI